MNVNPGGSVPAMRDTVIPLDNPYGHGGQPQMMTFDTDLPDDHLYKIIGLPKGMKVILAERGYTKDTKGRTLIGDCKACKAAKSRKPHLEVPQLMTNVICMVKTATIQTRKMMSDPSIVACDGCSCINQILQTRNPSLSLCASLHSDC
jgi:hypothetical protein